MSDAQPTTKKRATAKRAAAKRDNAKRTPAKRAAAKRNTARPSGKLSTRDAIVKVLTDKGGKMTVAEIADAALKLTALKGATPKQTFYSVLYAENRKPDGIVKKAGDGGVFKLNPKRKTQ